MNGDRIFKRSLDLSLAVWLAALLLPVFTVIAVIIVRRLGSPIIFRQLRAGFQGKPFYIYKFRTMSSATDAAGKLLPDIERLTPLGALLRNWSLDELPQLFNVIRGELSLVGPRPLLMRYLPRYSREQARRHDVKPGITGWAQINGRNSLTWKEKFEFDVWYVDHWSLGLDMKILLRTVEKVLTRQGVNQDRQTTMPEFIGN